VVVRNSPELDYAGNSKDSRSAPGVLTQVAAGEKPITPKLSADARKISQGDVKHVRSTARPELVDLAVRDSQD
jgi:hypothetical protein